MPVICGGFGVGVEAQVRQPVEQLREHDLGLHAGEVQPEAHVRAPREREVLARRPEDVELLGVAPSSFSSWFAEPMLTTIIEPAGIGTPSTSVSRVAVRMIASSGGSHRRPSSIACGISARSSRSASSWSGLREQAEEQVARRPVRGLGAGGEQQPEEREDLVVGEALPSSSACASTRDHVVGRVSRGARR